MSIITQEKVMKLIEEIDIKTVKINNYRSLHTIAVDKLKDNLVCKYIYNSNAIEGNRLTERETYMVLKENYIVSNKTFQEHLEASNLRNAIQYADKLLSENKSLDSEQIKVLHSYVTSGILPINESGVFRNGGVAITASQHMPPTHEKVSSLMQMAIERYNTSTEHILLRIFRFHHDFTNIHPFFDGNGRTARLITNIMLLQNKYTMLIIDKDTKMEYYDALEYGDLYMDYRRFFHYMLTQLNNTCDLYIKTLGIR